MYIEACDFYWWCSTCNFFALDSLCRRIFLYPSHYSWFLYWPCSLLQIWLNEICVLAAFSKNVGFFLVIRFGLMAKALLTFENLSEHRVRLGSVFFIFFSGWLWSVRRNLSLVASTNEKYCVQKSETPIPFHPPMTSAFNARRFWPKLCNTTPPSRTSTSEGIRFLMLEWRPWSISFLKSIENLFRIHICCPQALANALQHNKTITKLHCVHRIEFGDAGRQARWVARFEESMLAPLPGRHCGESRSASRRTKELLQRLSGSGLRVFSKLLVTFCFWFSLLLLFDFKISRYYISRDLTEAAVAWCGPVVEKHTEDALPFKYFSS